MKTQYVFILFAMLICSLVISPPVTVSAEEITGTPDDTPGVFLFSAGGEETAPGACDGIPASAPTGFIIEDAIEYNVLTHVGDTPLEVIGFVVGSPDESPDPTEVDTTIDEVITGLTAVDDFGDISNGGDDDANFDTGTGGEFAGGHRFPYRVVIADGIVADGTLGSDTEATTYAEADDNLGGMEIFIMEDSELSGFRLELFGPNRSWVIHIDDFQINPSTNNAADDTLIGIDLDSLPGWDGTFITDYRITDDGIVQSTVDSCTGVGALDQSLEIDAIVARDQVVAGLGKISGTVLEDTNGDSLGDLPIAGVEFSLKDGAGNPVLDEAGNAVRAISNEQGDYLFEDIFPGAYNIVETQPANYDDVSEADGGDDNDHSDNGVENNIPVTVELEQDDTGNNFVEVLSVPTAVSLSSQNSNASNSFVWVIVAFGLAGISLLLIQRKRA